MFTYYLSVKELTFTTTEKEISLNPHDIQYINIIHNYDEAKVPVLKITFGSEASVIRDIGKTQKVTAKIEIVEEKYKKGEMDKEVLVNTSSYINDSFRVVLDQPITSEVLMEDATISGQSIYLIKMGDLDIFDIEHSMVLHDATADDMLFSVLSDRGVKGGITIASKPHLKSSNKIVMIPSGNLTNNLKHMNIEYGLYKGNPFAYKDFDRLYILDKYTADTAIGIKNELLYAQLNVGTIDKGGELITGSLEDKKQNAYMINLMAPPKIENSEEFSNHTDFSTSMIINPNDGKSNKKTLDKNAKKVTYKVSQNPLRGEQAIRKQQSNAKILYIANLKDTSLKIYKPYRLFMLKSDNTLKSLNLDDTYKMITCTITLEKKAGSVFSTSVSLVLRKVIK